MLQSTQPNSFHLRQRAEYEQRKRDVAAAAGAAASDDNADTKQDASMDDAPRPVYLTKCLRSASKANANSTTPAGRKRKRRSYKEVHLSDDGDGDGDGDSDSDVKDESEDQAEHVSASDATTSLDSGESLPGRTATKKRKPPATPANKATKRHRNRNRNHHRTHHRTHITKPAPFANPSYKPRLNPNPTYPKPITSPTPSSSPSTSTHSSSPGSPNQAITPAAMRALLEATADLAGAEGTGVAKARLRNPSFWKGEIDAAFVGELTGVMGEAVGAFEEEREGEEE